jgi:hypothetical protein
MLEDLGPDLGGAFEIALERHERDDRPVSSSDCATTAASATFSWATIADSTSAVESRWPDTLITP